jgi:hypothetical protein
MPAYNEAHMFWNPAHKQPLSFQAARLREWLRVEQRRIAMAANCTRRTLQVSLASARTLLSRTASAPSPFASKASKLNGRFSVQKRMFSRLRFYHFPYPVDSSFKIKLNEKNFILFGC